MSRLLPAFACLLLAIGEAGAENVWRCGPDGRVFSDRPCAESAAPSRSFVDAPTAADRQAAEAVAQREQRLARQLVKERESREAQAHANSLGGIRSEPPPGDATPRAARQADAKAKKSQKSKKPKKAKARPIKASTATDKHSKTRRAA